VALLEHDEEEAAAFNPMRGRVKKIPPGVRRITLADYDPASAGMIRKVLGHRWRPQRGSTNWVSTELNREILRASSADEILKMFDWHGSQFDRVNLLTSLHRIARLAGPSIDFQGVRRLAGCAIATFPELEIWEMLGMANSVWACAKLRIDDGPCL